MKTPAFIFDDVCLSPDRQIGIDSHPQWELSYVVCGSGMRTIGNQTEPFRQGEIILIPPYIPHVWRFDPSVTDAHGNISNISVFFDSRLIASMKDFFPEIEAPLSRIGTLTRAVSYCGSAYMSVRHLLTAMRGLTSEQRLPKMIELLIAASDISECMNVGRNDTLGRAERRLEQVRVYCSCNYARHITLDELSRHVGMNRSAFCTFMRHHAGVTLSEFVNTMRLDRAVDKLRHSDCNIAEIALDCGFQNVSYFNRLFRARYGCSPKAIRAAGGV